MDDVPIRFPLKMLIFLCHVHFTRWLVKKTSEFNSHLRHQVAEEVGDVKHLVSHNDPAILVGVVLRNLLSADWHCFVKLRCRASRARSCQTVLDTKALSQKVKCQTSLLGSRMGILLQTFELRLSNLETPQKSTSFCSSLNTKLWPLYGLCFYTSLASKTDARGSRQTHAYVKIIWILQILFLCWKSNVSDLDFLTQPQRVNVFWIKKKPIQLDPTSAWSTLRMSFGSNGSYGTWKFLL